MARSGVFTQIFVFLIVSAIGTAALGYSAKWLKTVFHLASESHDQWNSEREDFPAGFQVGSRHHHHATSGGEDCSEPGHHSVNFHLNELAGSAFVSINPPAISASTTLIPLVVDRFLIAIELLSDQGNSSNLFRPPIV